MENKVSSYKVTYVQIKKEAEDCISIAYNKGIIDLDTYIEYFKKLNPEQEGVKFKGNPY